MHRKRLSLARRAGNTVAAVAITLVVGLPLVSPGRKSAAPAAVPVPFSASGNLAVADPAEDGGDAAARREPEPLAEGGEAIYRRAVDAVAWIVVNGKDGKNCEGTGVLIDAERGYVLTAYHVIEDADAIGAVFPARDGGGEIIPNRRFYADDFQRLCISCVAVAGDAARDLALLRLNTPTPRRTAVALAATETRPGQWLCLIGNAPVMDTLWGFVSGHVRQVHEASYRLTTNQEIHGRIVETSMGQPGDSGGPLLDKNGRLVGIHSSGYQDADHLHQSIDVSEMREFLRVSGFGGLAAGSTP